MKPTNKFLLIALALLTISFTAFRIIFNNLVELAPTPFKRGMKDSTFAPGNVSVYHIRGNYSVQFIKSEYESIKINGPDNLIDKYTTIERNGNVLSIAALMDLGRYPFGINITINTRNIGSLSAGSGAIVTLENFNMKIFKVTTEDSASVSAEGCGFNVVKVSAKNSSIVSIDHVTEASVKVQNSSSVFLTVENGAIDGVVDKNAELILLGEVKKNSVIKNRESAGRGGRK